MMGDSEVIHLLWADDDSYDALDPLARRLEKANFRLLRTVDYIGAKNVLATDSAIRAVLLDVILPHEQSTGSLAFDLGMTLADRAAKYEVKSIVFLTVVRQDDVLEKYKQLERDYPRTEFSYFDKTQLLEQNVFQDLTRCLRATKE